MVQARPDSRDHRDHPGHHHRGSISNWACGIRRATGPVGTVAEIGWPRRCSGWTRCCSIAARPPGRIRAESLARACHETDWEDVAEVAPVLAATCRDYLAPARCEPAAEVGRRDRGSPCANSPGFLVAADPPVTRIADVGRSTSRPSKPTSAFAADTRPTPPCRRPPSGCGWVTCAFLHRIEHLGLPRRAVADTDHARRQADPRPAAATVPR